MEHSHDKIIHYKKFSFGSIWWCLSVTQAFGRLKQEDFSEFKANLGYKVKLYLKNKIK